MKTWKVIDLIRNELVYDGSFDECMDWVAKQSDYYKYSVLPFEFEVA